ncbi:hypothetical protein Leryth_013488 [Lithospermum erythrorhizon]|nr:hypothetical protein Leryth_013488 [Lithospermum erythrorhizon]
MHAKTDSEVTSLAPSSPDHTRRPAYYVQSPSRDSHDGDKTTSFHSTPAVLSPMGSPPHSNHSRESSTSRFSGSLKPVGSTQILPNEDGSAARKKGRKIPKDWEVIEEEGLLYEQDNQRKIPRRCYVLAFVLGFFILFSLFSLILLAAAKPQKPKINMKSIKFETLGVQAGSDATGVSTDMITTNSTVKFTFRNTASFFGLHVTSTPLHLSYSQLTIGSGSVSQFFYFYFYMIMFQIFQHRSV